MSLFKYCVCGNKISYEINPPASCPKCGINFAQAFKNVITNKPIVIEKKIIEIEPEDEDSDYEIIRVKKKKKSKTKQEIISEKLTEDKTTEELENEDFDDSDYQESNASDLSDKVKEGLEELGDIVVNFGMEEPEKLGPYIKHLNKEQQ